MRLFFLLFCFLLATSLSADASPRSVDEGTEVLDLQHSADLAIQSPEANQWPIFGRKKTSNKRQRKFATKRSRRHGKGVMRSRKNRDKRKTRSRRGGKKKAGCNT